MMQLVTKRTILETQVEFWVDSNGYFIGVVKNEDGSESNLTARHQSLLAAMRAARQELKKEQVVVAVPFLTSDLKPAIARGRHARAPAKVLVWIDDGTPNGKKDQIYTTPWRPTQVLKPDLTPSQLSKLQRLFEARAKTQVRLDKLNEYIKAWEAKYSFDLGKAVDEAIAEQTQTTT